MQQTVLFLQRRSNKPNDIFNVGVDSGGKEVSLSPEEEACIDLLLQAEHCVGRPYGESYWLRYLCEWFDDELAKVHPIGFDRLATRNPAQLEKLLSFLRATEGKTQGEPCVRIQVLEGLIQKIIAMTPAPTATA